MKVVFLVPMAGKDVLFLTNKVYDLPTVQAKRFIEHEICVEHVEEKVQVKKTVIGKQSNVSKKKVKK